MKIIILVLLALASLVASAPQSRFGTSRYQPAGVAGTDDTTEAAEVVEEEAGGAVVDDVTDDADLDAVGHDAEAAEDGADDTTGTPYIDNGEKRPAYGLDAAKERRRLANLHKRFRPGFVAGEESSVTDSPGEEDEAAPSPGGRAPGAGQQAPSDQGQAPEEEETQAAPVSNYRRRFQSQSTSAAAGGDASEGNGEETAPAADNQSDLPPDQVTYQRRTPGLRRRQQSTPAPSDDQSQDEATGASEGTESEAPAESPAPAGGTRTRGSLKERLERYRQRQAERLGTASQADPGAGGDGDGSTGADSAGDGSAGAQASDGQVDATADTGADATAETGAAVTAETGAADSDFKKSGEVKQASRFSADYRHHSSNGDLTSGGSSQIQAN